MNRSVLRGTVIILAAAVVVGVMFFLPGKETGKKPERTNLDPWTLVSYDPDSQYGTYLGNGFIATRIKGDGVGSQNGRALPCFMAGFYDDEKLIPTPTWSDLRLYDSDGNRFQIDKRERYRQRLLMKSGLLVTDATWRSGRKTLSGSIDVVVSRAQPNAAMVFALLMPNFDGSIRVESPVGNISKQLEPQATARRGGSSKVWWSTREVAGTLALTCSFVTRSSGIPLGLAMSIEADRRTSPAKPKSRPAAAVEIPVKRDSKFMIFSRAALATGHDAESAREAAVSELEAAIGDRMDFIKKHRAEWEKLWEADIIVDGPKKDQQALHSCMFYLLQSVREGSQWSIPPMGLSNNEFSGHVLWDADTWMLPALILQHPELARAIVDYRCNTLEEAKANAEAAGFRGAQYAWESGYTGVEGTQLVYRHERHINGDVALAQWQYYLATGDLYWLRTRGYPVIKATADYWVSRAKFVRDNSRYEIDQIVPPDENADLVNNNAYTNAIARVNLEIARRAAELVGERPDPKWSAVAGGMYIPVDTGKKRFIAFEGYKGYQAKQADTELLIYPLQFKIPRQDMTDIYKNTFAFYAPKVMKNGPAMSSSAHAVIAARLGDTEKAYADFVASYKPYLRGPFNYFNEKRSRTWEKMCFLTGAAGPIQSTLFGLAGIRMDYFPDQAADPDLHYSPCLPRKWKSLRITGVQWRGKAFDVVVSGSNKVELSNVRSLP